ncbi:ABC transporter substrate-binding protein [Pyrobaculum aerophilum]|uniref:Peptide ABC transporter substrate-binding protein n=1 Tax=Pyrobaculum aerophilum TaxID=13773 RepID=A0A371QV55_9CREN|nr:ABC transporter substrate-binding protein [Pyrobaculum aerophilum]RFA93547.1 peptide ABC transporter substrate-binding protein [Pyrobaculum aerophilum]RFA97754.1 peptide ABC transporter substrate-binding protein [Pyrobaculum aerophilum]
MSRSLLIGLVVLIVLLAVVAVLMMQPRPAQTPTPTPTASPSPTTPSVTSLTIGVTDKVTDLDPANAYDFFTWEVLYNTMAGLVRYRPGTTELEPDLALSWTALDGGRVWVFKLRPNLKFCDGTPLTAQDVKRSIERVMKINGDPAWLVTDFVERVEAPNETAVVFYLKKPVSYFLALLATPPYFPVHPKYAPDKVDSDQTAGGAGPYCIKSFVRDQQLVLEANPYYYGPKPQASRVVIRFYKDATTLRLALERGEVDIAWRTLSPPDIEALRASGKYKVVEVPGSFIRYIVLNLNMPELKDVRVREALAAAVCRSSIVNVVYHGTVAPLYTLIPEGMWSSYPVFKEKYGDCNTELAKQLLQQAGFGPSKKLNIELWYTPTHYGDTEKDLAAVLKEQWETTGMISVTVKSAEWATYVQQLRSGAMMVSLLGWYPDYLDPDDYTTPFLRTGSNKWLGNGYSNPKMDEILDKAALELSQGAREQLYRQAQQLLAEDVPIIPLVQGKLFIVTKPSVQVVVDPTMILRYWAIKIS